MARVTVEDCIENVDNRFDLVVLASHRVRLVASGANILVEKRRDKKTVIALREIAEGSLSSEDLREDVIHSMQKYAEVDEADNKVINFSEDLGTDQPLDPVVYDEKDDVIDSLSEEELIRSIEDFSKL